MKVPTPGAASVCAVPVTVAIGVPSRRTSYEAAPADAVQASWTPVPATVAVRLAGAAGGAVTASVASALSSAENAR